MGWFFKSKKEKIDAEIKRIRNMISQLEYELSNIRELRNTFIEENAAVTIRDRITALIDQILKIKWEIFTLETLTAEGYILNPVFASNEAHNFELYSEDQDNRGFIPALKSTKMIIASTTPGLAVYADTMKRARKYNDPLGYEKAIENYLRTITTLEGLLASIIKDLTDSLRGYNALICGLNISAATSYKPRASGFVRKWAMRLALASTLATAAGFAAASPTTRSGVASIVKSPIQNIRIGTLGIFSVESLQEKVDEINNKIKRKERLSDEEVEFLKALYQVIATGGSFTGLPIAGQLLNHYVNGESTNLQIDPEIYTNCPAVQEAMRRMREYIEGGIRRGVLPPQGRINSTDENVRKALKGRSKDKDYQNSGILRTGFIKSGVADSKATFYANRRFPLTASYVMQGDQLVVDWSVTDVYNFRDKGNMSTLIPMPGGKLKLWDRISCAIATTAEGSKSLDPFAREFDSTARWTTVHRVGQPEMVASNTGR